MDVRVENSSEETGFRGRKWIVLLYFETQFEPALFVGCVRWALDVTMPVEKVVVDWCQQDVLVFGTCQLHQLFIQSITRCHLFKIIV